MLRSAGLAALFLALSCGADPGDRVAKCLARHNGGNQSESKTYGTDFPGVTWDEQNWILSTTTLEQGRFQSRGSVANGYFGISVAAAGPFFEADEDGRGGDVISGWPLYSQRQTFSTIAGFYDAQPRINGTNFPWLLQYGSESVISGLPHWSALVLDLGDGVYLDAKVDGKTIQDFRSTFDFKAGILSWSYRWAPSKKGNSDSHYDIRYRIFVNKLHVNEAVVELEIVPSADGDATVVNVLDGYAAVRTDFVSSGQDDGALYSAVRPVGISNVTAFVYANMTGSEGVDLAARKLLTDKMPYVNGNDSSAAQSVPVHLSAGKPTRITKYVGVASSDAFADPRAVAKKATTDAMGRGLARSLQDHIEEWANVMPESSVDSFADPADGTLPQDNYIIDSAVMSVANTFYLLQNTVGPNAQALVGNAPVAVDSIAVSGLTADSYAGLIFWDADLFMQPGLVVSHPRSAQSITQYRVDKYAQAKANAQTSFTSSKNKTTFTSDSAIYPWTSGRFGNCTCTGPCWDYEYHLSGDIGISFVNQWVATGDTDAFKSTMFPIYDSVATTYAQLLAPNGSKWTLTNMTDPDEYANHVDAGGFTMPLIAEILQNANTFRGQFGKEKNATWDEMAKNVLVIRENDITLEFTTMNGSASVKQADVILDTFPLSYSNNFTTQDALNDLDYYAYKQSPDGPAMTWAFFSIVANDVSPSGCSAYTYAHNAYKPYARAPFYQLSEQRVDDVSVNGGTHAAFPFLTGHGGANQVTIFGYLGLRMLPDDVLHINPNLPPQLSYLRYRTFYWRGWPVSAWSNATHTTVRRAKDVKPLDTADKRFANQAIAVELGRPSDGGDASKSPKYQLPVDGDVVVPNRQIGQVIAMPGDLVQCRPATSSDAIQPGQFPIAATDGATSTKWQPELAKTRSAMTVTLAAEDVGAPVSALFFNWAQAPPVNATVLFHNDPLNDKDLGPDPATSNDKYTVVSQLSNIKVSDPYDAHATNLDAVVIPTGNTTNVTLDKPVPAARYATLLVVGNQGLQKVDIDNNNGTGATVATWSIVSDKKKGGDASHKKRSARGLTWRERSLLTPQPPK